MMQNYNIQLESLEKMKGLLLALTERLDALRIAYSSAIHAGLENGLSMQMYEKLSHENIPKMSSALSAISGSVEEVDINWISNLIDAYHTLLETAGQSPATQPETTLSSAEKAQRFREATQKIKEQVATESALWKKDEDSQPQNQRDIHADYLAAFLNNQKSR